MSRIAKLLEEWRAAMLRRDQLVALREGMRNVSGVQFETRADIEQLLQEAERELAQIQTRLLSEQQPP